MDIFIDFINDPFCLGLIRTTFFLSVGFCLVEGFLRLFKITSARICQFCYLAVLLLGWVWIRPSLEISSEWSFELFTTSLSEFADHKPITLIVFFVWAVGIGVVLLHAAGKYLQQYKVLSETVEPAASWQEQWEKITKYENLSKPVLMRVSFSVGPTLIRRLRGFELVIPMELWKALEPRERVCLLRLQVVRLRNRNHWKFLFARLLMLPHWFNPIAWFVLRRFDLAVEYANDEQVYHQTSEVPQLLGNALEHWKEYTDVKFFAERKQRLDMLRQNRVFAETTLKKAGFFGVLASMFLALVVQVEIPETETDSLGKYDVTSRKTMDE
jgi:hypothetical protein